MVYGDGQNELSQYQITSQIVHHFARSSTELASLGLKIEKHYGAPQDIEWARNNGKFYTFNHGRSRHYSLRFNAIDLVDLHLYSTPVIRVAQW